MTSREKISTDVFGWSCRTNSWYTGKREFVPQSLFSFHCSWFTFSRPQARFPFIGSLGRENRFMFLWCHIHELEDGTGKCSKKQQFSPQILLQLAKFYGKRHPELDYFTVFAYNKSVWISPNHTYVPARCIQKVRLTFEQKTEYPEIRFAARRQTKAKRDSARRNRQENHACRACPGEAG